MSQVRSFPPIADARARVLIVGSMPGTASLAAAQYYAHPQNLFWHVVGELTGADAARPYAYRARALKSSGIALWDVLATCMREGSLDSAIDDATIRANDFAAFYRGHPRIAHVFFNGAKAEACYRKYVLPALASDTGPAHCARLPSTSPAHASMPRARKQELWRRAIAMALADRPRAHGES
jgi:hypoxanthine-DNA glycosylase